MLEVLRNVAAVVARVGAAGTGFVLVLGSLWWSGTSVSPVIYWFEVFLGISLVAVAFLPMTCRPVTLRCGIGIGVFLATVVSTFWSSWRIWMGFANTDELIIPIVAMICTLVILGSGKAARAGA